MRPPLSLHAMPASFTLACALNFCQVRGRTSPERSRGCCGPGQEGTLVMGQVCENPGAVRRKRPGGCPLGGRRGSGISGHAEGCGG